MKTRTLLEPARRLLEVYFELRAIHGRARALSDRAEDVMNWRLVQLVLAGKINALRRRCLGAGAVRL